jgi:hypothetical protein
MALAPISRPRPPTRPCTRKRWCRAGKVVVASQSSGAATPLPCPLSCAEPAEPRHRHPARAAAPRRTAHRPGPPRARTAQLQLRRPVAASARATTVLACAREPARALTLSLARGARRSGARGGPQGCAVPGVGPPQAARPRPVGARSDGAASRHERRRLLVPGLTQLRAADCALVEGGAARRRRWLRQLQQLPVRAPPTARWWR